MATIDALLARMNSIKSEIETENKKKSEYEKLLSASNGTKSPLSSAYSDLKEAEGYLKGGGYAQEGININSDSLSGCMEDLDSVISKTKAKLEEIESKISRLQSEYDSVYQEYLSAQNAA